MSDELFVFVHIPKTGGQTLRNHFITHMSFHDDFIHLGPHGIADAERRGLPPFEQRAPQSRRRARVILGHYVTCDTHLLVDAKVPLHITFIREPAEMLVSYYNFQMEQNRKEGAPPHSFDDWYDTKRGNLMTSWLHTHFMQQPWTEVTSAVFDEVVECLDTFWFVGLTEFLDEDAPLVLERIGVATDMKSANVAGKHYPKTLAMTPGLRERLNADNAFDWRLFEYARARREQRPRG